MITKEIIISACSILIALSAVFVSVWSNSQTREHNQLSVKPKLEVAFSFSPNNDFSGVLVFNHGLGPAIIKNMSVSVDGKTMLDVGYGGLKTAVRALQIDHDWVQITYLKPGSIVASGTEFPIIAISKNTYDAHIHSIQSIRDRLKIEILYESLYEIADKAEY